MTRFLRLDYIAPAMFVLGLLALAFGWGYMASRERVFPGTWLSGVEGAARAVWEAYLRPPPFDRPARAGTPQRTGITADQVGKEEPNVTFRRSEERRVGK